MNTSVLSLSALGQDAGHTDSYTNNTLPIWSFAFSTHDISIFLKAELFIRYDMFIFMKAQLRDLLPTCLSDLVSCHAVP